MSDAHLYSNVYESDSLPPDHLRRGIPHQYQGSAELKVEWVIG